MDALDAVIAAICDFSTEEFTQRDVCHRAWWAYSPTGRIEAVPRILRAWDEASASGIIVFVGQNGFGNAIYRACA